MKPRELSFNKIEVSSEKTNFEEIYYAFFSKVEKLARYNAGSEFTEDITQEVFFKVHKNLKNFKEDSSLGTWIYKITLNTCHDFLRKKQRRFKLFSKIYSQPKPQITQKAADTKIELERAIVKLSPPLKQVFTLFYFSDLKIADISEVLEIPSGTVKSRLNSAKKQIQKHFQIKEST